jgi:hypothetical protein
MISTNAYQVSRARNSIVRFLALFLTLGVMTQGLYFANDWAIFGIAISVIFCLSLLRQFKLKIKTGISYGITDIFFCLMLALSLLGLLHPVKIVDGFLETMHWGIYWLVYRLGSRISLDEAAKNSLVQRIVWLSIGVALMSWLPWLNRAGERLGSVFGYPNTAAAFIGAVLLLMPESIIVWIILGITLLGTGSRAGLGLFLVVLLLERLLLRIDLPRNEVHFWKGYAMTQAGSKRASFVNKGLAVLFCAIGPFILISNKISALRNLAAGFAASSWLERVAYWKDGIKLAWKVRGIPQAGAWMAFSTVQHYPYWTADPHSSAIHILLNQGILGILGTMIWIGLTMIQVRKLFGKRLKDYLPLCAIKTSNFGIRAGGAVLFLSLHSLVDADFSFGALGILFWMLFGCLQGRAQFSCFNFTIKNSPAVRLSYFGLIILCISIGLFSGTLLVKPQLVNYEISLNRLAQLESEKNPNHSVELWTKSLMWDQTQIRIRQEQSSVLFQLGNIDSGLKAAEMVLFWHPYDINAYEWAQSEVWKAAEREKLSRPETADKLYEWVENVPRKINEKRSGVSAIEKQLWRTYQVFQPSQHIKLLAEQAKRVRQSEKTLSTSNKK